MHDRICLICGSEDIDTRNAYRNQPKGTVGFALEFYCTSCGSSKTKRLNK